MSTPPSARTVRSVDVAGNDVGALANSIQAMDDDELDLVVVRNAFGIPLAAAGESLDAGTGDPGWARPNAASATEDIQLLGMPATPTYSAPRGPSLDTYFETADWYEQNPLFGPGADPAGEITRVLGQFSGGRRVEVLKASDGRQFAPFNVRRLTAGKGISLHHDYHYPLAMFEQIASGLDTRTLISYVFTLRKPDAGGELVVYPVTPDTPDPPKLPSGWAWDLPAIEQRFPSTSITTDAGDLFMFASGRCLHRVAPGEGSKARITMGGFLAMDKAGERILYWS